MRRGGVGLVRRGGVGLAALAVGVAGLLAGCGIPADADPHTIEPPPGPYQALASPSPGPAPTEAGPIVETLFMLKGGTLVAVERQRETEPLIATVLTDLLAGPTDAERAAGISSPLQGGVDVEDVTMMGDVAVVTVSGDLESTARTDQKFAYGQIVCTLDARPEVNSVTFVHDGQPVQVPKGDSTLSKDPLTEGDYASLR